jgi:hypothetical protein
MRARNRVILGLSYWPTRNQVGICYLRHHHSRPSGGRSMTFTGLDEHTHRRRRHLWANSPTNAKVVSIWVIVMALYTPCHSRPERIRPHFSGLGLFKGLNQAYNCIFYGYVVNEICSQDIFRGIAKFLNSFHFRHFPGTGLRRKSG